MVFLRKLILQEGAATGHLSGQLVFGTLPGWWLRLEPSRKWGLLLTEPEWDDMLLKSGFSGADLVFKDCLDENIHAQSLIVATAPSLAPIHHDAHETIIVVSSLEPLGSLVAAIRASMQKIGIPEVSIVGCKDLEGRDLKQTVCIALLELETSVFVGEANFTIMQRILTTAAGVLWVTNDLMSNPEISLSTGLMRSV
jgi:hypothetical protein